MRWGGFYELAAGVGSADRDMALTLTAFGPLACARSQARQMGSNLRDNHVDGEVGRRRLQEWKGRSERAD
jgi:hypothetical protein